MEHKDGITKFESGEPCGHPGCGNHVNYPCPKCGRIGTRGNGVER